MWAMGQMMYAIPVLILLSVLLRREGAQGSSPSIAAAASDGAGHLPGRAGESPIRSMPSPHP
jgi:hypothetical protein